jgi:hypothetical protein
LINEATKQAMVAQVGEIIALLIAKGAVFSQIIQMYFSFMLGNLKFLNLAWSSSDQGLQTYS